MKRNLTTRSLVLAIAVLAASACQKTTPQASQTASTPAATNAETTPQAVPDGIAPAAPAPRVQVCTLLSAAEVSALMGKKLIQDGCSYGLDPAAQEKAMADTRQQLDQAQKRASAGDMSGFMKGMMRAGANGKAGSPMMDQMTVSVDASRDNQTEEEVKAIFAKTGATVRGALSGPLAPEKHGVNGVIEGLDEVGGVGDWAFATNVASTNLGAGFTIRGRILEARKGPWHVTVSATVSPDPGAAALDGRMAGVARALIAKL
jgi:hypothetical protein